MAITVGDLIKELKLEELNSFDGNEIELVTADLNRPGMQLAGFLNHFANERVQIIGKVEHQFLNTLDSDTRRERLEKLLSYDIPCIILSRNLEPHVELINAAEKYKRKLLRSEISTTKLTSIITNYLEEKLAPNIIIHGVLMEIYGIGVLIIGKSGIGKSETAVELIKRGHLFLADDAVEIRRIGQDMLIGNAPELTKYMIEVRGIGIMDVKSLFGVGAIKIDTDINLVVKLEDWDPDKDYDRIGADEKYKEILGIKIPEITVPVKPARNIVVIIEMAARNHRLKAMGYNAAKEFNERLYRHLNG
ncbi:MAG: HPr kinase/phosphorylase [Clostridiales bacterium]|nr:HPr kinase/phosphorylase [Clostridiales bacterium]